MWPGFPVTHGVAFWAKEAYVSCVRQCERENIMQDQTQNKVSKPTINQRFEAWKQKQGRTRIVLFWSGLWTFTALFCLAGWFMIHAAQPPTKFEFLPWQSLASAVPACGPSLFSAIENSRV
jgi:hypothetical protein